MPTNIFAAMPVHLLIAYSLSLIILIVGSLTDLKTREVPDFVNYGFIISGIALNLLFSVIYSDFSFIIHSIAGLLIFFGIAYAMFYAGQWGGGDSKMLMGMGAMIGIDILFLKRQFLLGFFINAMFVGAAYGLLWSAFLALKNKKRFWKELTRLLSKSGIVKLKNGMIAVLFLLAVSSFLIGHFAKKFSFREFFLIALFGLLILITFYLWIFIKAVEKSAMYRLVEPSRLTEGDWIAKDISVSGKYITGPRELGISKSQIRKLLNLHKNRKVKKILIKEGIPFVPSFLIAFVVTLLFGNLIVFLF